MTFFIQSQGECWVGDNNRTEHENEPRYIVDIAIELELLNKPNNVLDSRLRDEDRWCISGMPITAYRDTDTL